ncbi:MAG: LamG-like jellyroll fold domain-containing protein, partial [Aureliella sp.]
AAMGCLGTRLDEAYAARLIVQIADAIVQAHANLQPARIGWTAVEDWEHTHNRRWIRKPESLIVDPFGNATGRAHMHPGYLSADIIGPSGPVDPTLSIVAVQSLDGQPLAVLANYSQHYFGAAPISADYYGLFCKYIAELLGQPGEGNGPFVAALSQGTSGDLMWMDYGAPAKSIAMAEFAEAVAKVAERGLSQIEYHDSAPLSMVEVRLPLDYRVPDAERLAWAEPISAKIEDNLPKSLPEVYAQEALILHQRQRTELKLQAIRIGELTIATLPNEVYALTGLKLRARSPAKMHFNIELANGAEGYIPPPEQHTLGGYTTWPARTAGLEVKAETKIVEALTSALEEATGQPRRSLIDEHGPYALSILAAKPLAYWRMNDFDGSSPRNAVEAGPAAQLSGGYALYLPGAGSGSGIGDSERLTASAFSRDPVINRAIHFASGSMTAKIGQLGDHYTLAAWIWLGERSGASRRSGLIVSGPAGEKLIAHQDTEHRLRLELVGGDVTVEDTVEKIGAQADSELTQASWPAENWNFVVLVRDGNEVRVHINGSAQPVLKSTIESDLPTQGESSELRLADALQGKLDEIALFQHALSEPEITRLWESSEMR